MTDIQACPDPTYCTVQSVKDKGAPYDTMTDENIELLICRAEEIIDTICGYHERYYRQFSKTDPLYQEQWVTFPRVQDFVYDVDDEPQPFIPFQINKACLSLVEIIYNTDQAEDSAKEMVTLFGSADSARIGDFAVSKRQPLQSEISGEGRDGLLEWLGLTPAGKQVLSALGIFTNLAVPIP